MKLFTGTLFIGKLPLALTGGLLLGAVFQSASVMAETRFITDIVYVPLRSGLGSHYKILNPTLKTGTRMTVLEADADRGYSKVVTDDGVEGYILNQYLIADESARERLPEAMKRISELTSSNQVLNASLQKRDAELKGVQGELESAVGQLKMKSSEFIALREATADPQALEQRIKELVEENVKLKNRISVVEVENAQLIRNTTMRWYLYGGGTIFLGIALGIFLPRIRFKKKAYSDWV